ncbi:hypothetical protein FJ251_04210 [bacterium]|nr:hypothetical protein [bacterium]
MMKKLLLIAVMLGLAAGAAFAKDEVLEKPLTPDDGDIRATESEPNNSCATANLITPGDPMTAAINPAGEYDYFRLEVSTAGSYTIFTGPGDAYGDTQMYLYASNCTTQLAYDDDSGDGYYSRFVVTLAIGTYYIRINEYGNNGTVNYILRVNAPAPPPPNDTCAGAINLDVMPQSFTVDLCPAANNYSPGVYPTSCTGWSANGPDVVYYAILGAGGQIDACINGSNDLALYLITDCGNPVASCVDGDDSGNPECISWSHPGTESTFYYLIVDTYSGCGVVTVTVDNLVSAGESSFSSIKSLY